MLADKQQSSLFLLQRTGENIRRKNLHLQFRGNFECLWLWILGWFSNHIVSTLYISSGSMEGRKSVKAATCFWKRVVESLHGFQWMGPNMQNHQCLLKGQRDSVPERRLREAMWEDEVNPISFCWANEADRVEKWNVNVCRTQQNRTAECTQSSVSASWALRDLLSWLV